MHRFFVPPESISDGRAALSGDQARQIARVLRQSPGDSIILLDNSGQEYDVLLTAVSLRLVEGRVTQQRFGLGELDTKITLYQALLKRDRFDLVLQKGTELGVSTFVPIVTERTVARASEGRRADSRLDRWQRNRHRGRRAGSTSQNSGDLHSHEFRLSLSTPVTSRTDAVGGGRLFESEKRHLKF